MLFDPAASVRSTTSVPPSSSPSKPAILASCVAASHSVWALSRPVSPIRRRRAASVMSRCNAAARGAVSPGGTSMPHVASTISRAPPSAVVTTGSPAYRASTKAIPNGSGSGVRLAVDVGGGQHLRHVGSLAEELHAVRDPQAARAVAQLGQVYPLIRPLGAAGDPADPAGDVRQARQGLAAIGWWPFQRSRRHVVNDDHRARRRVQRSAQPARRFASPIRQLRLGARA